MNEDDCNGTTLCTGSTSPAPSILPVHEDTGQVRWRLFFPFAETKRKRGD